MLSKNVLVVGAGPVGLSCSLFLQLLGLKPRLIQKKTQFSSSSNAVTINSRTLDILSKVSVTERILKEGLRVPQIQMYHNNRLILSQLLGEANSKNNQYPFLVTLPQSRTEELLRETLKERGTEIETGTELKDIKQHQGKVQVKIAKNGQEKEEEYDIVFAADGARSAIRTKLNIPFQGSLIKPLLYLYDYETCSDQPQSFDLNSIMMIPLPRNRIRLISNQPNFSLYLSESPLNLGREIWRCTYSVDNRLAKELHLGNVYLGGDSAHTHAPIAGRGMNMGIEDAYAFAELLKKGQLAKYTTLRRPILQNMTKEINKITEVFTNTDSSMRTAMPYAALVTEKMLSKRILGFATGLDQDIGV